MNAREQRGLVIAALCKLNKTDQGWLVPSQSGAERIYHVDPEHQTCICPDCQEGGFKCKHIFAVEFTIKREVSSDGTVTETKSITLSSEKTYPQDWHAYNMAQSVEKHRFQVLLQDLCRNIKEPEHNGKGRKPHLLKDSVFATTFKVYCGFSSRRFSCDLQDAFDRGHLSVPVPGMKVINFMENPTLTPIFNQLISKSTCP